MILYVALLRDHLRYSSTTFGDTFSVKKALKYLGNNFSRELQLVLLIFIFTRIALTLTGVMARILLQPLQKTGGSKYLWNYHKTLWLDIWSVWDSGWYLHIAQHWYDLSAKLVLPRMVGEGQSVLPYFPLYPALMKLTGAIFGSHYLGGIIISNLAIIIAGVLLYRLAKIRYSNEAIAENSVYFLFLFPTAFIFSGVFTESLFLALLIACFYYAEQDKWHLVGILGFMLSLTRPLGVVTVLPLAWEYLRRKDFNIYNIKINILYLGFLPAGLLLFAVYNYYLSGDFLAFTHHQKYWGRNLVNPFSVILKCLGENTHPSVIFTNVFIITILFILSAFIRYIGIGYWLLGIYSLLIPLASVNTATSFLAMTRFAIVIFPLYLLLGMLHERQHLTTAIMSMLAIMQGFLMVFWSNGFMLII